MKYVRQRVPVGEVGLGCEHRREGYDVQQGARHTITREGMTYVPRVAEGVMPALLDRQKERVRHATEMVFQ